MARINNTQRQPKELSFFVGIDPGQAGGIAVIDEHGKLYDHVPMPDTRKGMSDLLRNLEGRNVVAVVESVHSMPKQGVASTFKFGKGYGTLLGICTALDFKLLEPTPQAWKKAMLVGTDKSKNASIQVCENLFPTAILVQPRCRKPHDGVAEAILLAEYGRKTF
jgi:Holliday junction resolvasome RuvABC endonuclease subunit